MALEKIKDELREYIINSILHGDAILIENNTPLISGGIIDSISTLKMVDHLEKMYKIEVQPHEVDRENLDTIDLIAGFVISKL